MRIDMPWRNYRRLVKLKKSTGADSIDEVIDWLLDFWFSWQERPRKPDDHDFGFNV